MALRRNKYQQGDIVYLSNDPEKTPYVVRQSRTNELENTFQYRLDCGWHWEKDLILVQSHLDMLLSKNNLTALISRQ